MNNELDESKTKYFVVAIILLIILGVVLVIHFNNKSLVSGDEDIKVNTTTKTNDTTKKIEEETEVKNNNKKIASISKNTNKDNVNVDTTDNVIYKSTIDKNTNILFNYKLSSEINDTDILVGTKLSIIDSLRNNNVVGLYDITLYDANNVKKSVKNSLITISIPLGNLVGYDNYKVVYIDDNNVITDEVIESKIDNGYIKFDVKHLSKYGIIATKNVIEDKEEVINKEEKIDLSNVTIGLKINNELVSDYSNMYVSTIDKVSIVVNGLDTDYKIYTLLQNEDNTNTYVEFNEYLFSNIKTPNKYKLSIKIDVNGVVKVFEVGTVNVYDIVFTYDKTEELTEDKVVGTIINDNEIESDYKDKETNKNIVIKNIETEENISGNEKTNVNDNDTNNNIKINDNTNTITINENNNVNNENNDIDYKKIKDNDNTNISIKNNDKDIIKIDNKIENKIDNNKLNIKDKATIKLNGNIYLVEKTDISKLEITGHLIIDTNEDITFAYNDNKLLTSNIYSITIKSKEFSLNGVKYTYEFVDNNIVIKRIEEEQEVYLEDFSNIFNDYQINKNQENEELILEKNITN